MSATAVYYLVNNSRNGTSVKSISNGTMARIRWQKSVQSSISKWAERNFICIIFILKDRIVDLGELKSRTSDAIDFVQKTHQEYCELSAVQFSTPWLRACVILTLGRFDAPCHGSSAIVTDGPYEFHNWSYACFSVLYWIDFDTMSLLLLFPL